MEVARTSEIVSTLSHAPAPIKKSPSNVSQKSLLSGAIKRRTTSSEITNEPACKKSSKYYNRAEDLVNIRLFGGPLHLFLSYLVHQTLDYATTLPHIQL